MAKKETVLMRPAGRRDRFNDPIAEPVLWSEVPGATCVPRNSSEDEARGPIVIAGFMVAMNAPVRDKFGVLVPLAHDWEVQIRGEVHQIEGDVGDYGRKIIFYTLRAK